jgi:hypothetical protein
MSPVQQFASQAVASTLGRRTDVDACVELVGQIDRLLDQAATHLQSGGGSAGPHDAAALCASPADRTSGLRVPGGR